MFCYFCGEETPHVNICPHCGANLRPYWQILSLSDFYYNEGLDRANVRDLTGAVDNLKLSLKYNKYNIDARNLLGLVYFETQQLAAALCEWVISTNYQPEYNRASIYLEEFENNPGLLLEANQGVRKYNMALEYCRRGSRDLAAIQLKKVRDMMPGFVPAYQLLALLHIQDGKYEAAQKLLREASKIDTKNTITLRYTKEVNEALKESGKRRKKRQDDVFSYQSGNETIIIPRSFERVTGMAGTMANIAVGIIIGLLAMLFLVVPSIKQNVIRQADEKIARMSSSFAAKSESVTELKSQVDDLTNELEDYQAKADVAESNDTLIKAYLAYQQGDATQAGKLLANINPQFLGEDGMRLYEKVTADVNAIYLVQLYQEGSDAFEAKSYETAIEKFLDIIEVDVYYGNGGALYYLGQSYRHSGNLEEAKIYYAKLVKAFPNTKYAETASKYVTDVEIEQADIEVYAPADGEGDAGEGNNIVNVDELINPTQEQPAAG